MIQLFSKKIEATIIKPSYEFPPNKKLKSNSIPLMINLSPLKKTRKIKILFFSIKSITCNKQ